MADVLHRHEKMKTKNEIKKHCQSVKTIWFMTYNFLQDMIVAQD